MEGDYSEETIRRSGAHDIFGVAHTIFFGVAHTIVSGVVGHLPVQNCTCEPGAPPKNNIVSHMAIEGF